MKGFNVLPFVLMLLLIFVLILFLNPFKNVSDFPRGIFEFVMPSSLLKDMPGGIPDAQDFTDDPYDTTSTEVACGVARALSTDVQKFGYGDRADDTDPSKFPKTLDPLDPDRNVVGLVKFKFHIDDSTGKVWSYDDLGETAQKKLVERCSDTGTLIDCPTPYLDEECISGILNGLKEKHGRYPLCTKLGEKKQLVLGGEHIDFGNDKCAAADGTDNCGDLCPGGDKIYEWYAPKSCFVQYVKEDLSGTSEYAFPPKECEGLGGRPSYAWILEWNKKEKYWEIIITKVPDIWDFGKKGVAEMKELAKTMVNDPPLLENGEPQGRTLTAAPLDSSLRTVWDIAVQPTENILLSDFVTEFERALNSSTSGEGWRVVPEKSLCNGRTDCLRVRSGDGTMISWYLGNDLETVPSTSMDSESKYMKDIVEGRNDVIDQSISCAAKKREQHKVNLRTSISMNDYLKAGQKYRIVLRWWVINKEKPEGDRWDRPDCGTGIQGCVACFETTDDGSTCLMGPKWAEECKAGLIASKIQHPARQPAYGFFEYKTRARYQELRLIIVEEPVSGG